MSANSSDYHDYVFKGGRLVGEFDAMYRNSSETPWHQDESAFSFFSSMTLTVLHSVEFSRFLEIGCGLGYFTRRIQESLRGGAARVFFGADISSHAVDQARQLHPEIDFFELNILNDASVDQALERMGGPVGLLLSKEVLWYVTDHIEMFVKNAKRLIGDEGRIYISQSFPEVSEYYGRNVFQSPEQMGAFFSERFVCEYLALETDRRPDGKRMVHFIGRVR